MLPCSHILEDDELDRAVERQRCLCGKAWPEAQLVFSTDARRRDAVALRADAVRALGGWRERMLAEMGSAPAEPRRRQRSATLELVIQSDREDREAVELRRTAPWPVRLELWWMRLRLRRATRGGFRLVLLVPNAPAA